ncbi:MAG: hypothetical protein V2I24_09370 [Halieaceae bacterium]|jgi:hypothetical protein|nr:hypothetical protein [Halieaceae bacterium]
MAIGFLSDAWDFVQDTTTALFDFATTPIRAAGDLLFPDAPTIPQPDPVPTPGISGVQRRRDLLRRQAGRQGRRSLILTERRNAGNTGMRPRGGTTIGSGG